MFLKEGMCKQIEVPEPLQVGGHRLVKWITKCSFLTFFRVVYLGIYLHEITEFRCYFSFLMQIFMGPGKSVWGEG